MERDYTTTLTTEELAQRLDFESTPTPVPWPAKWAEPMQSSLTGDRFKVIGRVFQANGVLLAGGSWVRIRLSYTIIPWSISVVWAVANIGLFSLLAYLTISSEHVRLFGEPMVGIWGKWALALGAVAIAVMPVVVIFGLMQRAFEQNVVSLLELERVQNS